MGENEYSLDVSELSRIAFECPRCSTVTVFQASSESGSFAGTCPGCNAELGIDQLLAAYRNFFRRAVESKRTRVHFKVAAPASR